MKKKNSSMFRMPYLLNQQRYLGALYCVFVFLEQQFMSQYYFGYRKSMVYEKQTFTSIIITFNTLPANEHWYKLTISCTELKMGTF